MPDTHLDAPSGTTRIRPLPVDVAGDDDMARMRRVGLGIWEHRPDVRAAFDGVYVALAAGTLGARLTELLRLRIAFHNQCRSCMAVRYATGVVDEALVCELAEPEASTELSAAERAALRFADLFATDHLAITDELVDELRGHFDEGQLVELSATCALYVGIGRLMATWRVVDDLPESFRQGGRIVTPWGHETVITARSQH